MEKFVDKIAEHLLKSNVPLEKWVIILPSERAKQYIQRAIYQAYKKPVFSPRIFTIHQWIKSITSEKIINKTRLLLKLYRIHSAVEKQVLVDDFDEFLSWGNMLLSDFDEIDRYLVDSKQLFRNLRDIKEIENWSFGEENLTKAQKEFIEFWDKLPVYYNAFNEVLQDEQACYMGMAYRRVAESIDTILTTSKEDRFLFAGFNALSAAEKSIMKQLHQMGKADIIFDIDSYYLNENHHEAGYFIRNFKDYLGVKELPFVLNSISTSNKKIEIISCAQHTGQAKAVSTILQNLDAEKINNTLVLVADESLMVPLITNIPKNVGKANITLGLPLKNTSLRSWIELIFRIQERIEKYGKPIVYHKDILAFWSHPFIASVTSKDEEKNIREITAKMRKYNTVFQNLEKIKISASLDEIASLIYIPWGKNWAVAIQHIRKINSLITNRLNKDFVLEKTLIHTFDASIIDFQHCVNEDFPSMQLRTFKTLFQQEWMTESMAYFGNPLDGLQIMGLLETRLLDFETIIIMGMNEGKMPPTNPIQSLIPMDLRNYVKLPVTRDKQGLFAHHFYRLLHHSNEIYITYSTSSEGMNSNEPSRYIMQLELELARHNPDIEIHKKFYTLNDNKSLTHKKEIVKNKEIFEKLDDLLIKGISASALKTFITCPLDFYFKYILNFGEEEKVDESIESNQLGTFVHEVLEDLYRPFCKRNDVGELISPTPPKVQVEDIERMEKNYELLMRKKFSEFFEGKVEAFLKGKNYLSFTMALELTKRFLAMEKKFIIENKQGIAIEALEEKFEINIDIEIYGVAKKIKLKGFADRIDSMNNAIRIVDYKTGKVKKEDIGKTSHTKWTGTDEELLVHLSKECKHFFQLMLYSFLYYKKYHRIPKESAIISLVNLNESPFIMNAKSMEMARVIELFPVVLGYLLEEIYNPDVPFTHTQEYFNYCVYCV
jgi:ATP-dependent helicase/nuclease subunit B